jgi:hypothetical protein
LRILIWFGVILMWIPGGLEAQTAPVPSGAFTPGASYDNGVQSKEAGNAFATLGVPADLKLADVAPVSGRGAEATAPGESRPGNQRRSESAFMQTAPAAGPRKLTARSSVTLIMLGVAVHGAVTWDAQSTNHFFSHCPSGYRPFESDPIMRPFAGKAAMYPMSNLIFAVPFDLLLYRTRRSGKLTRAIVGSAAGMWAGVEVRQSVLNIRNEHISSR